MNSFESNPSARREAVRYLLRRAGEADDAELRPRRRSPRRGFGGKAAKAWSDGWIALPVFLVCAAGAAFLYASQGEIAEARLTLSATADGAAGAPASERERAALMTQLRDAELMEEVVRRLRLHRAGSGGTVAERTESAARRILDAVVAEPGAEPGLIELRYTHRNPQLAEQLLNTFAEMFAAERGALVGSGAVDVLEDADPAAELGEARRALAEFLRMNPISRIDPQREQNLARIAELETEVARANEALKTLGQGDAARALVRRRDEFQGMIQRHRTRLDELDRLELRRKQLERRVENAESAVAGGSSAPSTPVSLSPTHVAVVAPASVEVSASDSLRLGGAVGLFLAGLLGGWAAARWFKHRRRRATSTSELEKAASAPILVLAEEAPTDVS